MSGAEYGRLRMQASPTARRASTTPLARGTRPRRCLPRWAWPSRGTSRSVYCRVKAWLAAGSSACPGLGCCMPIQVLCTAEGVMLHK